MRPKHWSIITHFGGILGVIPVLPDFQGSAASARGWLRNTSGAVESFRESLDRAGFAEGRESPISVQNTAGEEEGLQFRTTTASHQGRAVQRPPTSPNLQPNKGTEKEEANLVLCCPLHSETRPEKVRPARGTGHHCQRNEWRRQQRDAVLGVPG